MKYFLHDTSAFEDEKVSNLFIHFGYEGVGLFYALLEKIGKQEKPVKTDVLKAQLKVKKRLEKCWNFMEEIGLISTRNGETFNENILNFSEKYQIKKEKTRKKVSDWREKQALAKSVTDYVPVRNHRKVKESKVNINKEEYKEEKNTPSNSIFVRTKFSTEKVNTELPKTVEELAEKKRSKIKVFNPPSLDDVKAYFLENGFKEETAIKAFNYYSAGNWKDSSGKQVLAWKQKMISVWFKDENKIQTAQTRKMVW